MAGVVQRTRQKSCVVFQPVLVSVLTKAVTLGFRHLFGSCQDASIVKICNALCTECVPRRAITLDTVRLTERNRFIIEAIVQRLREGQDVFNFHLIAKQHGWADLYAGIGTASVGNIFEIEFFPQNHFLNVCASHSFFTDTQHSRNISTKLLVALLIFRLPFVLVVALFLALLQIARQFNNHFAGVSVAFYEGIHDKTNLVQPNMHSGVGDTTIALFVAVFRVVTAKTYMTL